MSAASGPDGRPVFADRGEHRLQDWSSSTPDRRGNFERSKGAAGQFHANLKAAGIDPQPGRHRDHLALPRRPHQRPARQRTSKPAFPNAEILVPAPEWKYFMDDGEMGKQTTDRMKGVFARCAEGVRRARPQGHAVRGRQGSRAGHHLGGDPRPHAGPHVAHHRVGQQQGVRAERRHQQPAVRAQSGLAPDVRPGRPGGRSDPPQGL